MLIVLRQAHKLKMLDKVIISIYKIETNRVLAIIVEVVKFHLQAVVKLSSSREIRRVSKLKI